MKVVLTADDFRTFLDAMAVKRAKTDKDLPDEELGLEATIRDALKYKMTIVVENA